MQRVKSGVRIFAEKQWRRLKSKMIMMHGQNDSIDVGVKQVVNNIAQVINGGVEFTSTQK